MINFGHLEFSEKMRLFRVNFNPQWYCLFHGAVALRHGSQHVGFDVQKWQQMERNFSTRLYSFQVCPRQIEKLYLGKAISFLWCFFPRLKVATDIDRNKPARIMERSIFSERYCFLENQRRNGILSAAEFALMDHWFQWALNQLGDDVKPDLIGITQCLKIARKISFDIMRAKFLLKLRAL